jgi:hypothetical protein
MTFALVIPELAAAGQTEVDSVLTLVEVKEAVGAHRSGCCLVRGVGLSWLSERRISKGGMKIRITFVLVLG